MQATTDSITQKLQYLSPEQLAEVEHLIATMRNEDIRAMSELSFATIWNDPENDIYDAL